MPTSRCEGIAWFGPYSANPLGLILLSAALASVLLRQPADATADGRVLESKDFYAEESGLTGESIPAEKHASGVDNQTLMASLDLPKRSSWPGAV